MPVDWKEDDAFTRFMAAVVASNDVKASELLCEHPVCWWYFQRTRSEKIMKCSVCSESEVEANDCGQTVSWNVINTARAKLKHHCGTAREKVIAVIPPH